MSEKGKVKRKGGNVRLDTGGVSKNFYLSNMIQKETGRGGEGEMKSGGVILIIVITNDDLFDLPKLAHLAPEILVESIKVILQLARIHLDLGVIGWILVQVWE